MSLLKYSTAYEIVSKVEVIECSALDQKITLKLLDQSANLIRNS